MKNKQPETLMEAMRHFADPAVCRDYVAALRWPNGVACPTCGSMEVSFVQSRGVWACKTRHERWQFSVKVGTIFEDSPIGLDKWLCAMWLLVNAKNGISSYELSRSIGVTQQTGWFMLQRLRLALEDGTFNKMDGEIEADETFIGGKARNMHKAKRTEKITGTGGKDKVAVMGLLQREGPDGHSIVRTAIVPNTRRSSLGPVIRVNVETGATVYSDGKGSYNGLEDAYLHAAVNHDAQQYVDGAVHTNSIENFWALVKRALSGTYVSVEPFHLFRYLDEEVFRFNSRHLTDGQRFHAAMKGIVGKRLTYAQLTASEGQTA